MNNLEQRTLIFAKNIRLFIKSLPKTLETVDDFKQLIRSSGSIGANYIEANECLGKKDMLMRLRISRKEAKESLYWLLLMQTPPEHETQKQHLIQEVTELKNILSSIITKCN